MLTIYLKAVFAVFRQTLGDLWGVIWRPRHTLHEIFERGTWYASLILLVLIGYIGMPGMVVGTLTWEPFFPVNFNHIAKVGETSVTTRTTSISCSLFNFSDDYHLHLIGYLFLLGFLVTLLIGIKSYAKTGQWYSFLRIAGYCMLPAILLMMLSFILVIIINFLAVKILILQPEYYHAFYLPGIISFIVIGAFLFFFLTFRLLTIMLNIVYPAMNRWQRLVTALAAFLGGDILISVCLSIYKMINIG